MNEHAIRRTTALASAVALLTMVVAANGTPVAASNGDDVFANVVMGGTAEGGNGADTVTGYVLGTFNGGNGNDRSGVACSPWRSYSVFGTFRGGRGDDTISCDLNGEDAWLVGAPPLFDGGNGNDTVERNVAWNGATFDGGRGDDTINGLIVDATFDGGPGDDSVGMVCGPACWDGNLAWKAATFNGGKGNDHVGVLKGGTFNGGPGIDTVDNYIAGTCIDVEVGCP